VRCTRPTILTAAGWRSRWPYIVSEYIEYSEYIDGLSL
jgi:hypothetical protein